MSGGDPGGVWAQLGVIEAKLEAYGSELDWLGELRVLLSDGEAYSSVISRMGLVDARYNAVRRELHGMLGEDDWLGLDTMIRGSVS